MNTTLLLPEGDKNEQHDSSLSLSILHKIEAGEIAQVPRWQFLLTEYGIWVLWGLSILFGAVASSVTIFFLTHAGFGLYEATHDTAFDLLLNVLPVAWVVAFVLMAIVAHYNLRHTKRGYRYTVWQVLVSSIVFSLAGGLILHTVGVSFLVDDFMERQASIFPALNRVETHIWQAPQNGRMVGMYVGTTTADDVVFFLDTAGLQWRLDTSELNPLDLQNLYSKMQVHVIGIVSTSTDHYFYGCGVFPWTLNRNVNLNDIWSERQSFINRMEQHERYMLDRMSASDTNMDEMTSRPMCAQHTAVIRIQHEFAR